MDENYWKDAYKDTWSDSSEKEAFFAKYVKDNTGLCLKPYGLGAGNDSYISGSAKSHGCHKGDPDYHIIGTNVYVEVTGPLTEKTRSNEPLWFRPDKIKNAIMNQDNDHITFFAHYTPSAKLWRVIHVDQNFVERYKSNEFNHIKRTIRGRVERYVEILSTDNCIQNLDYLINYLRTLNPLIGSKKTYKCPNCGAIITKNNKGYYFCSNQCGMYLSVVYGTNIGSENVERLLNGESCEITTNKGIRTRIEPFVETNTDKDGKTYINWKTKKT